FWLRDTNSSNGTFVNNTRVHKKAGEDFSDREIFSGDIIRFGVDVVERDTTHGCIIAQVTIYLGNGCEAKPNLDQTGVINGMVGASAFHSEQVFLLFHLANEALFREQSLVDKLDDLKRLVSDIQEISETGWQAMLREDRLLEKLALYESQLSMLKEDLPQDSLQNHLCQALEDKMSLEKASKIMLARILEEKTEAMTKAADLEVKL
ncbi:putative myosin class ii heavy chain, partial [Fasciolopsis buskii]